MPKTKDLLILGIVVLIIGVIVGWVVGTAYLYSHQERVCSAWNSKPKVEIVQQEIDRIMSLEAEQIIIGVVLSKENNQIDLGVRITNPLDITDSTDFSVKIPFNSSNDEILRLKKIAGIGGFERVEASFDDIKVNDFLAVNILEDKKIIYLPVLR